MSQKSSVPQAISFVSQVLKRDSAAMYAACFSRRGLPRRDAAAVAAGPDVIR